MSKLVKRALIGGGIAAVLLLAATGVVVFKAARTLAVDAPASSPQPLAAALALPTEPVAAVNEPPKAEAPPGAPAADLANAFGAALGVEVKKSNGARGPVTPGANAAPPSSPASDTLDLGAKKDREARFGGHDTAPSGVRQLTGRERSSDKASDEKLTFETELK